VEALRDPEDAAPRVVLARRAGAADDVLAEDDNRLVARQLLRSASLIACWKVMLRAIVAS